MHKDGEIETQLNLNALEVSVGSLAAILTVEFNGMKLYFTFEHLGLSSTLVSSRGRTQLWGLLPDELLNWGSVQSPIV